MKNRISATSIMVVLFIFVGVAAYSQEDMTHVDNSVFVNPKRPPSVFEHDLHNENAGIEECNVCHHVYEDGKLVEDASSEDQSCSDCHSTEKTDDGMPHLMNAFHLNCKGCHMEKKAGPVMCGECHVK